MKRALVVVDVQTDFLPGGRLAVPLGDEVIPVINELMREFELIVATQDWHPPEHQSFASRHPGRRPGEVINLHGLSQVLWPDHCVQGSAGAELASKLDSGPIKAIFRKGTQPEVDSYSGFFDNGRRQSTGLEFFLRGLEVREVVVLGLALDYCVKATALDARSLGFETRVVVRACRAVNVNPGDDARALDELRAASVVLI